MTEMLSQLHEDIEARVAHGDMAEVVWGNHDAIDRRLGKIGETRELTEWFMGWRNKNENAS